MKALGIEYFELSIGVFSLAFFDFIPGVNEDEFSGFLPTDLQIEFSYSENSVIDS